MTHISRKELKDIELRVASENIKRYMERNATMYKHEYIDYGVDDHEVQFVMETEHGVEKICTYDFKSNTGVIGRKMTELLSKRLIKIVEQELMRISRVIFNEYREVKWIREIKTEKGLDNGRNIW